MGRRRRLVRPRRVHRRRRDRPYGRDRHRGRPLPVVEHAARLGHRPGAALPRRRGTGRARRRRLCEQRRQPHARRSAPGAAAQPPRCRAVARRRRADGYEDRAGTGDPGRRRRARSRDIGAARSRAGAPTSSPSRSTGSTYAGRAARPGGGCGPVAPVGVDRTVVHGRTVVEDGCLSPSTCRRSSSATTGWPRSSSPDEPGDRRHRPRCGRSERMGRRCPSSCSGSASERWRASPSRTPRLRRSTGSSSSPGGTAAEVTATSGATAAVVHNPDYRARQRHLAAAGGGGGGRRSSDPAATRRHAGGDERDHRSVR